MGKRSDFARVERDFYPTPYEAVLPLLPHLGERSTYCEPCAGDGALVQHLARHGHQCVGAFDIEPQGQGVQYADALTLKSDVPLWITNPPWDRKILHPLITHLSDQAPCWLLFDADWMHTRQAAQFMPRLRKVVSVGRVKWIPDSKMTGKDNCCWYRFSTPSPYAIEFVGRA